LEITNGVAVVVVVVVVAVVVVIGLLKRTRSIE